MVKLLVKSDSLFKFSKSFPIKFQDIINSEIERLNDEVEAKTKYDEDEAAREAKKKKTKKKKATQEEKNTKLLNAIKSGNMIN